MSFLLNEFKAQPFRCPSCKRFINYKRSECRYCLAAITSEIRDAAVSAEKKEVKEAALKSHKQRVAIGLGLLAIGVLNIVTSMFDVYFLFVGKSFPCISLTAILLGSVIALIGLQGYLREQRS